MTTMLETIVPRSDQMNADDLAAGQTKTITITKITLISGEQPCSIFYDGDNGKPYRPGLSMRRVLVRVWGDDANKYIGRSMTLYCDPKVTFGGTEVGGIRISHMSHIDKSITIALTASKKVRKPFTVHPLVEDEKPTIEVAIHDITTATTLDGLKYKFDAANKAYPNEKAKIVAAKDKRKTELTKEPEIP